MSESDEQPITDPAPADEPSTEDDLAVIEGVATELAAIEAELAAMDQGRTT